MPVAFSIHHSPILSNDSLYPIRHFLLAIFELFYLLLVKKSESSNKFINCKRVCKESTFGKWYTCEFFKFLA